MENSKEVKSKINKENQPASEKTIKEVGEKIVKTQKASEKSSEGYRTQLAQNAAKQLTSFKSLLRPGSLLKGIGLSTGSPMLALLGDKINDLLKFEKTDANDDLNESEENQEELNDNSEDTNEKLDNIIKNTTPKNDFFAEQKQEEQIRTSEKTNELLEDLVDQGKEKPKIENNFVKGILTTIGIIVAALVVPFMVVKGYLEGLTKSFKYLNKITGGKLFKLFKPLVDLFLDVKKAVSEIKIIKKMGGFVKGFIKVIRKIIDPIINFFKWTFKLAKDSKKVGGIIGKVLKFSKSFGEILGKITLPLTVIMSAYSFVKGFMKGFKKDGIIGGIKEGLIGIFDSLIGGLIKMLTGAASWILNFLGFSDLATKITTSVNVFLENVTSSIRSFIDLIKGIFTGNLDLVKSSAAALFNNLSDIIFSPFESLYEYIKEIFISLKEKFSLDNIKIPDLDLMKLIRSFVLKIKDRLFSWFTSDNETQPKEISQIDEFGYSQEIPKKELQLKKDERLKQKTKQISNLVNEEKIIRTENVQNTNNLLNTNNIIQPPDMKVSSDDDTLSLIMGAI